MNVTELAHWRYRVKYLESVIPGTPRLIREAKSTAGMIRDYALLTPENRNDWDDEVVALRDEYYLNRWLLEEAKYMCELGKLEMGLVG